MATDGKGGTGGNDRTVSHGDESSKTDKLIRLAEAVLRLIDAHGMKGVTTTNLSRAAKVTRPWIYKYIGRSKDDLIRFAVDHFGRSVAEMDRPMKFSSRAEWIQASVDHVAHVLKSTSRYPWFTSLYFKYRGTPTLLGSRIADVESAYFQKQAAEMSATLKTPTERAYLVAEVLTAFRMGLMHSWQSGGLGRAGGEVLTRGLLKVLEQWLKGAIEEVTREVDGALRRKSP